KTSTAVIDAFGHAAAAERDDWRPAQHRFGQHDGKRLFPLDRHQHRRGMPEQLAFLRIVDRTDVADEVSVNLRPQLAFEIRLLVGQRRYVAGDHERASERAGHGDRVMRSLDSVEASEKDERRTARIGAADEW